MVMDKVKNMHQQLTIPAKRAAQCKRKSAIMKKMRGNRCE